MLHTSSTQETRHRAREFKFLVAPDTAERIVAWSRRHLGPDPYGAGDFGDEYRTTSLYFDTPALDVLHRRGSFARCKYRIRRYETAASTLFLERKLRTGAVMIKRRTTDGLDALHRLADGRSHPGWAGEWFRRRLDARQLQPTCQVTYARTARVGASDAGVFRLTLDREIRARAVQDFAFVAGDDVPVLDARLILELKFRQEMPGLFRRLVEEFALDALSVSKYRLSLEALHRLPDMHDGASPSAQSRRKVDTLNA